jgi:hypothetical protein
LPVAPGIATSTSHQSRQYRLSIGCAAFKSLYHIGINKLDFPMKLPEYAVQRRRKQVQAAFHRADQVAEDT